MAMGRRTDGARTPGLWIAANELPATGGNPFYPRLNQVFNQHGFDEFIERSAPVQAEKGNAWSDTGHLDRLAHRDSLTLRGFLGLGVDEPPEDSIVSRMRRLSTWKRTAPSSCGSCRSWRRRITRRRRRSGWSGADRPSRRSASSSGPRRAG